MPTRGGGGLDTSDATATALDIQIQKTAYAAGVKITGVHLQYPAKAHTPNPVMPASGVSTQAETPLAEIQNPVMPGLSVGTAVT